MADKTISFVIQTLSSNIPCQPKFPVWKLQLTVGQEAQISHKQASQRMVPYGMPPNIHCIIFLLQLPRTMYRACMVRYLPCCVFYNMPCIQIVRASEYAYLPNPCDFRLFHLFQVSMYTVAILE